MKSHVSTGVIFISEELRNIAVQSAEVTLPSQNTSKLTTYSYAVINRGKSPVLTRVQVGPTEKDFAEDQQEIVVPPDSTKVIVPKRFLRFTRLVLRNENPNQSALVDVYFQAQSIG
jgi:hypothetical protein